MYNRSKVLALSFLILLPVGFLVSQIPQAQAGAQFILSEWSYPDDYGQGIEGFQIFENSSGVWISAYSFVPYDSDSDLSFEWNASVFIKVRIIIALNSSLVGISLVEDGTDYINATISVTQNNGSMIYAGEGEIYFEVGGSVIYHYGYEFILNFLPVAGEIYTATITYEVYY